MEKKLITVTQASKLTGYSRAMIYHFINKGLPEYKQEAVMKFLSHTVHYPMAKHVDQDEVIAFAKKWKAKQLA